MSTEKEKTYEFQPVQEFEHYVVTPGGIFGFNRDSVFKIWDQVRVKFAVKIKGEGDPVVAEYVPQTFFAITGVKGNFLYWSVAITAEEKKYFSQQGGVITEIKNLPDEPAQLSEQFTGPVGEKYTVAYKEGKHSDWKNISNGKGYILNHQDSTFAYPLGEDRALLYVPTDKTLYVVYTMPNGRPAVDHALSINQELKIF